MVIEIYLVLITVLLICFITAQCIVINENIRNTQQEILNALREKNNEVSS